MNIRKGYHAAVYGKGEQMTTEQQNAETVVAMGKEIEKLQAELKARCNQCNKSETKKAFDRYQEFTFHFLRYLQKIGVVTDTSDTVEDIQDKLQAELDKHRWIPISERLPDSNVLVILYQDKPIPTIFFGMLDFMNGERKYVDRELYCVDNITHWKSMILPESEVKDV